MSYDFEFDFEGLPEFIQRKIISKYKQDSFFKDSDYSDWTYNLGTYINSLPNEFRLKAMEKGIEYGKACLNWHNENECENPSKCALNETWLRKIALAENLLRTATRTVIDDDHDGTAISEREDQTTNKDFTTARQVLAMHYIFAFLKVKNVDNSEKARFIEFMTGKNYKNIYDAVCNPLTTKQKTFRKEDLIFIRSYFEKLQLSEIVKMINNELDSN